MRIFIILLFGLLFNIKLNAQNNYIFGKVVNKEGQYPLSGASVQIAGTNTITRTDSLGKFTIKINQPSVNLKITFIGFTTAQVTVTANGNHSIIIPLTRKENILREVSVNTGYQTLNKNKAPGSYALIDSALFNRKVSTNLLDRLEGVTSSLLFDRRSASKTKLQIRGISTIFASQTPLIILDNFPYDGDINNINPNDIENVVILKDASASSIWGARAGNGVIVVTTKKGRFNQLVNVSFNTNVTFTQKPNLFGLKELPTSDYIDLQKELFYKGFYNDNINNTRNYPAVGKLVEILNQLIKNNITQTEADNQINQLRKYEVRNDFQKYIYQNSLNQQYSLNIEQGTDKIKYQIAFGYDRNKSQLKGNDYERYTLRLNHTFIPLKDLTINTNINLTGNINTSNSPGDYTSGYYNMGSKRLYPYTRLADENGFALPVERNINQQFINNNGDERLLDWSFRPLNEIGLADNKTTGQDLLLNLGLKYKILNSLSADIQYQFGAYNIKGKNYRSVNTYFTRNLINQFTDVSTGTALRNIPSGGILDESSNEQLTNSFRSQFNYEKSWGADHSFNAIAGFEIRQIKTESHAVRTFGYDDEYLTFIPVNYINEFGTYNNMFGSATIPDNLDFSSQLRRFTSFYSNFTYSFKNRYTLSASARKDESNIFGVEANRKGIPLWSVGTLWNLSDEPFYKLEFLPLLKTRLSYGSSGNLPTEQSASTVISYIPAAGSIPNLPYAYINNPPNPFLSWEKVNMVNVGIDFAFKGNRISGSVEYFKKNVKDMLGEESMDPTKGFLTIINNSANMTGKGVDLVINTINTVGAVKWQSNFLFSYVKNKITKYAKVPSSYAMQYVGDGLGVLPIVGKMPNMVISYKWAGLDANNGNPQGFLKNEKSSDYNELLYNSQLSELDFHGSPLPIYFGTFRNSISWKKVVLSINMTYKFDYYFRRNTFSYYDFARYGRSNIEYNSRWQKTGNEQLTNVPSFLFPLDSDRDAFYANSSAAVEKGDNIKIQDLQITYNIDKKQSSKMFFKQLQLYGYVNNLNIIIWHANKIGIDPDYINGLKPPVSVAVGIKMNF